MASHVGPISWLVGLLLYALLSTTPAWAAADNGSGKDVDGSNSNPAGEMGQVELLGLPEGAKISIGEMPGPGLGGADVQVVRGGEHAIPPELLHFLGVRGSPGGGGGGMMVIDAGDLDGPSGNVEVVNLGEDPMMGHMRPMGLQMGALGPMEPMGGGDHLDAIFHHMLGSMLGGEPLGARHRHGQRRGGGQLGGGAVPDPDDFAGQRGIPMSCIHDVQEYCSAAVQEYWHPARCLAKHVGDISDTCKVDLFLAPCKEEVGKHCDLLEQGMLTCLHAHFSDIGGQCQAAVKKTKQVLEAASGSTASPQAWVSPQVVNTAPTSSATTAASASASTPASAASTSQREGNAVGPSRSRTGGADVAGLGVRANAANGVALPALEMLPAIGAKTSGSDGTDSKSGCSLRTISLIVVAGVAFYAYRSHVAPPRAPGKGHDDEEGSPLYDAPMQGSEDVILSDIAA